MSDFWFYFRWGWEHIISKDALDHQLFILALATIYLLKDWKQVLILVTAFTIGHSITLALSVLEIVSFSEKWIEFLIPCTIVFTAITNLFQKKFTPKSVRINYVLALVFGLVHGMGFARVIKEVIAKDQKVAVPLFAFNVGVEAGQIVVVVAVLVVITILVMLFKVNRRDWVIFASGGVLGLSLKMALERLPW